MTYVSAESVEGGAVFMRSDLVMTRYDEDGKAISISPLPKMMILDPSFVIGVAGDDPVGAMINLLYMWDECETAEALRLAIEADGDLRREYLLLDREGEVWRYANGEWRGPRPFGWVGSGEARRYQNPDPFDFNLSRESPEVQEAHAAWARERGFDEWAIEEVLSGRAARMIGPEIAQLNAMQRAGPEVGSFMIEARRIDGAFEFKRQSILRVFGSPVLSTDEHVLRALLGDWMQVSHVTRSGSGEFPASLVIEFLGARITFIPCRNRGYSHRIEFLNPKEQPTLGLSNV